VRWAFQIGGLLRTPSVNIVYLFQGQSSSPLGQRRQQTIWLDSKEDTAR
jgi:hypothetical protein